MTKQETPRFAVYLSLSFICLILVAMFLMGQTILDINKSTQICKDKGYDYYSDESNNFFNCCKDTTFSNGKYTTETECVKGGKHFSIMLKD